MPQDKSPPLGTSISQTPRHRAGRGYGHPWTLGGSPHLANRPFPRSSHRGGVTDADRDSFPATSLRDWRLHLLFTCVTACSGVTEPAPLRLIQPVIGTPNVSIFYGAYRDVLTSASAGDYQCGNKTYDGHTGTDILIKNFVAMDSGVTVVAAASGTVTDVMDGEFDRNTTFTPASAGNHVTIEHADKYSTLYAHLRNGSVSVRVGQSVDAGTPIGEIGSSGSSNWPHLHFEVLANGKPVEPAGGPCNGLSLWANQLSYQNDFLVTDAGFLHGVPFSLASLLETTGTHDTIITTADSMTVWFQTFNQIGAQMRFELVDPNDAVTATEVGSENPTFALRYLGLTFPVPAGPPGEWSIRMLASGQLQRTLTFTLRE